MSSKWVFTSIAPTTAFKFVKVVKNRQGSKLGFMRDNQIWLFDRYSPWIMLLCHHDESWSHFALCEMMTSPVSIIVNVIFKVLNFFVFQGSNNEVCSHYANVLQFFKNFEFLLTFCKITYTQNANCQNAKMPNL